MCISENVSSEKCREFELEHTCTCVGVYRQLVVEALKPEQQAMLCGYQLVLQLGHLGLVGGLRQVVGKDVNKQVEQDQAVGRGRYVTSSTVKTLTAAHTNRKMPRSIAFI